MAVICLAKDPGLRRMAENTAAANLKGADAVPSYQVLGDADLKNRELVKSSSSPRDSRERSSCASPASTNR